MQETSTITKILMAVLTAGVITWATALTNGVNRLNGLEPVIMQQGETIDRHDDWIARWPTEGELAADVEQTTRIGFLFIEAEQLRAEIAANEERLRQIELQMAAQLGQ